MDLSALENDGYQIVRSVIPLEELPALLRETDRLKVLAEGDAPLDQRLRLVRSKARSGERLVRGLQNSHHVSAIIDGLRLHPGIGRILQSVLGPDIKTVLTSIFWKPAGEPETGIAYHQDAGFRTPPSAFRDLARSYLQVAIALDPQDEDNGGLRFVPGSHRQARLFVRPEQSVLLGDAGDSELRGMGLSPEKVCAVHLEPGDVAMWNAFTVHGSGPNRSADRDRRSFTIASMRAGDCDVGIDAYVDGRPVAAAQARIGRQLDR
jgi:ectoine hydroxylase-related dioxygenase (phytanoyl-CoA dioxygenase family)